jgi:hypothetical protein
MSILGERILASLGEDYLKLQLALDKVQRVAWIESLVAPTGWEVMCTFTFRWEASVDSARRCYERWIRKRLPQISWFYCIEPNPSREGCHVHALWADCLTVQRSAIWHELTGTKEHPGRWGYSRIEPVKSKADSSAYASKYLTKSDAWFDLKLQWHRLQTLHSSPFELERGQVQLSPDTRLPVPQHEFGFAADVFNLASDPPADPPITPTAGPACDPRQVTLWRDKGEGLWEVAS